MLKVRRELGTDLDTEETIYSKNGRFLDTNQLLNFVNEVSEDPRPPLDISEGYGYSLRIIKSGYQGPLIKVRESSGNTTKDFYADFTGKINEQELLDFCGSNDGHVSKWYNQSGVERTLEANTPGEEPKIVESGVVVRNSLDAIGIKFEKSSDSHLYIYDDAFNLQEQSIFLCYQLNAAVTGAPVALIGNPQSSLNTNERNIILVISTSSIHMSLNTGSYSSTVLYPGVNSPSILNAKFKGADSFITSNKILGTGSYASLPNTTVRGLSVGEKLSSGSSPDMTVSEVIQYTSAQTGDNSLEIEASLNKYYKVYGDAYVSTWYDQSTAASNSLLLDDNPDAAAAYSLRKLRTLYQGSAINVRRASDDDTKNIGFTSSGELDVDDIINFCEGSDGFVTTWYNQSFTSKNELLLDTTEGQNAEAAYSVRQLSATATECMVIRRSSDSKLRTIGFKGTEIDEAEIETFCTGTTCTVYQWLDQSGNDNTATAASGQEPTIYTGGEIVKESGKPAIDFQSDVLYTSGSITLSDGAYLSLCVATTNGGQNNVINASDGSPRVGQFVRASSTNRIQSIGFNSSGGAVTASGPTASVDTQFLGIGECTGTQLTAYLNGTGGNSTGHTNITDSAPFYVGARNSGGSDAQNGYIQEVIHYASDQSSVRTDIEENINNYYGIFSTNNAEQDVALNQPKIYDGTTGVSLLNAKPVLTVSTKQKILQASYTGASTVTVAAVTSVLRSDSLLAASGSNQFLRARDGSTASCYNGTSTSSNHVNGVSTTLSTRQDVYDAFLNNQSLLFSIADLSSFANLELGQNTSTGSNDYQELIIWNSDESSNRTGIESNINSHYRIYGHNDASQTTAADQPKLVTNGRVILENGKPAVEFDGSDDHLSGGVVNVPTMSISVVSTYDDISNNSRSFAVKGSQNNQKLTFGQASDFTLRYDGAMNAGTLTSSTNIQYLRFSKRSTSAQTDHVNGSSNVNDTQTLPNINGTYTIAQAAADAQCFAGKIQEAIAWEIDQSAYRTDIESSINRAFGIYWDGTKRGLLDDQPNAAAAYSVRALSSAYTGPLVEIRDANGNTQDIYATYNGDLDENAINDFCTGSTCTIATWYDQSGNSNNATQGTALSQPTIYTGGELVKENGRVALFDGHFQNITGITTSSNWSSFEVYKALSTDTDFVTYGGDSNPNSYSVLAYSGVSSATYIQNLGSPSFFQNGTSQSFSTLTDAYTKLAINSTILLSLIDGNNSTWDAFYIGNYNNGQFTFDGYLQEQVFYTSDKSTDRSDVEENINRYYNIYSKLPGNKLLNNYPGAAAAYSLRAINSLYLGPLIRVRRDSDNVHADVYVDINLTISDTSKVGILSSSTDPIEPKSNTSLKTFMGGNNGFVAVWYDQAESNNASQNTPLNQPKIYDSANGVVIDANGKAKFEYSTGKFLDTSLAGNSVSWVFSALTVKNNSILLSEAAETGEYLFLPRTGSSSAVANGYTVAQYYKNGTPETYATRNDAATAWNDVQGVLTINSNSSNVSAYRIGYWESDLGFHEFQDLIIYHSDQSANRFKIESDINNYYSTYDKPKRLLDEFGGASAAYSLRRLNSLYVGPLVKIRRDSDNVEVNVYPDLEGNFSLNSQVTNVAETTTGSSQAAFSYATPYATLSQFVQGSPNCFVVEWKDQSSNSNHATQNAAAYQPKIYDGTNGVVTDANGNPSTFYTGTQQLLTATMTTQAQPTTAISVVDTTGQTHAAGYFYSLGQSAWAAIQDNGSAMRMYAGSTFVSGTGADNTMRLDFSLFNGANSEIFFNGNSILTGNPGSHGITSIRIGGLTTPNFKGHFTELVVYPSDQTSPTDNRTGIETNINTFYDIF